MINNKLVSKSYLIVLFAALGLFACKNDKKEVVTEPTAQISTVDQIKAALIDPCTFLVETEVSEIVDIPAENITIKSGGTSSSVPAKSCFFKWTGGEISNAGLLIQSMGNPVPDEFPEWAFFFIDNKKAQGEKTVEEPDVPIKFTSITDLADQACYNMQLNKCYFRVGDTVYLIALNGISGDDRKMEIFRTVADKILAQI